MSLIKARSHHNLKTRAISSTSFILNKVGSFFEKGIDEKFLSDEKKSFNIFFFLFREKFCNDFFKKFPTLFNIKFVEKMTDIFYYSNQSLTCRVYILKLHLE